MIISTGMQTSGSACDLVQTGFTNQVVYIVGSHTHMVGSAMLTLVKKIDVSLCGMCANGLVWL